MRYNRFSVLTVFSTALLAVSATPLAPPWKNMRVKHAWNTVPVNWESLGPPPPGTTIDLHLSLKPHNENALIDALHEVSSPRHPKYGAHLSREEVAKLVVPHPNTIELVHSWFAHHGIPSSSISTTHGGGWLTLAGVPVSQANELFNASYQLYQYSGTTNSTILRTVGYALPVVLHTHVQTVAPTTYFPSMRSPRPTSLRPSAALTKVVSSREADESMPEFLRWLYGTIEYVPAATGQNALGIVGYESPSLRDLTLFMAIFRTDAVAATFTVEEVNGGEYDPSNSGAEGDLIMQYAQAMAFPTPHIYYSAGGQSSWTLPRNEPAPDDVFHAWLNYMLGQDNIPQTITISYSHEESQVPLQYARTLCDLFAQLGARGVSVLFATGNDGVGPADCKITDGSGRVQFQPLFPSTCPWVTSVGGTTGEFPEVAAALSGGGFSNYFLRPAYQSDAVPDFLQHLGTQHDGLYNRTGRGIPDIAAQALNFKAVTGTDGLIVSGTGCAAPTAAGIISLLNDFLLLNSKPPLGFLNPWLYGDGFDGLNDILEGSNPGCGTDGFTAIDGWDPVTGLGTPDFSDLQELLSHREYGISSAPVSISTPWLPTTPTSMPTPRL